jgi:hypothetical protein
MKLAVGFIIGFSALALGCATVQETTMFRGPFGRTQIASTVLAADPASGKILVQTTDGQLRVFRVTPTAVSTLAGYRVGDDVLLTFDDRTSGDAVVALETLRLTADNMPLGVLPRFALPAQVRVGAPLVSGTFVAGVAADPTTIVAAEGTLAPGVVPVGGGGVVVPGFVGIGSVQPGALTAEQAATLGLGPAARTSLGSGAVTAGNLTPGSVAPGVTTLNPATGGKPSIQGPFSPGTVAPGVRSTEGTGNKPFIQGPFTPGTVAPGVSATLGNAAPATSSSTGTSGSAGSSQGLTIRTPGAAPPVPESATAATGTTSGAPAGGIAIPGMTGTGAPLTGNGTGTAPAAEGTTSAPVRDSGTVRQTGGSDSRPPSSGTGVRAPATSRPAGTTNPTSPLGGTAAPPSGPIGSQR